MKKNNKTQDLDCLLLQTNQFMPRNMIQELQWITVLYVSYIDDVANKHHINCKI